MANGFFSKQQIKALIQGDLPLSMRLEIVGGLTDLIKMLEGIRGASCEFKTVSLPGHRRNESLITYFKTMRGVVVDRLKREYE